ncbi:MAG: zinc-binding alcohol dehydrogenase family protein [Halobacteriales archaeon]
MRAVRFHEHGGADTLCVEDVPAPEVGPGEVLVEVQAAGVNHVDTLFREGIFDPPGLPAIPGSDFAGVVIDVGEGVEGVEAGDRVLGAGLGGDRPGSYAEVVRAPADRVAHLPDGVPFTVGAAMGHVGVAAWQAVVHHGEVEPGQCCLVHGGGGGLGHIAVQLAAIAGATVVTTASSDDTRARLLDLGADAAFDYRRDDLWAAIVDTARPDLIVDYHFDRYAHADIEQVTHGGRIVVLEYTTEAGGSVTIDQAVLRAGILKDVRLQLMGIFNGDIGSVLGRLVDLVDRGRLHIEVADTYDLATAPEVHRALVEESHHGKLVLEVA